MSSPCSVAQSRPTLCNPMDCNTPGLPDPHYLPKLSQVHVHCIGDSTQPPHPLTPYLPSALNLSQHQGLFQWVVYLHQVTKILELQDWTPLRLTSLISLLSKGLSGVFSSTIVRKHQFIGVLPSLQSSSHSHAWPLGRPQPWQYGPLSGLYRRDWSNWACTHGSSWSQFLGSSSLPHLPAENTWRELPWPLQRQVHARGSCFLSDPLLRNRHPTPLPLGIYSTECFQGL